MAYLTFRQSDQTITDAQKLKKAVIKGLPLTMYEVDANFKSLNDELTALRTSYGISAKESDIDLKSIESVYGSNDANKITASGFYRLASTKNVPSGANTNSVLIHTQNTTSGLTDVTALQITATSSPSQNVQQLHFRTKYGTSTWSDWETLPTVAGLTSIENLIDQCFLTTGGTISGSLTVDKTTTLNGSNVIYSSSAVKGNIPSLTTLDGFTVYDKTKQQKASTKLATFGLEQTSTGYSGVVLSASNPYNTSSDQVTQLKIGWVRDSNGNYQQTTYAPTPYSDSVSNLIATTGWVKTQIGSSITDAGLFSADGGTIVGDVVIEGNLKINDYFSVDEDGTYTNALTTKAVDLYHSTVKPTIPSATQIRAYNITDPNGVVQSRYFSNIDANGNAYSGIEMTNWKSSKMSETLDTASKTSKWIGIQSDADGTSIKTYSPSPLDTTSTTDTQIATTGWTLEHIKDSISEYNTSIQSNLMNWDLGTL